jgi:hypothetical protein
MHTKCMHQLLSDLFEDDHVLSNKLSYRLNLQPVITHHDQADIDLMIPASEPLSQQVSTHTPKPPADGGA